MHPARRNLYHRCVNRVAGVVTHVRTTEWLLALTFDDGPNPEATPKLLEILAAHGAKATFFMTGQNAAAHPELVNTVHRAGHAIGNHSWDHPSLPLICRRERRRQIRKTANLLPHQGRPIFRPPYGHLDFHSHLDLWLAGQQVIAWSGLVPDWEGRSAGELLEFARQAVHPGAIILMHDGLCDSLSEQSLDRRPTLQTVDQLLTELAGTYQCVTVPELTRRGRPVRECWRLDPDITILNQLKRRDGSARHYPMPSPTIPSP